MKKNYLFCRVVFLMTLMMTFVSLRAQDESPSCDLTVQMSDNGGDDWNGAYVQFYSQGSWLATATLNSGENTGTVTFSVPSDTIVMVWTKGSYDEECSFTVSDANGTVLYVVNVGDLPESYGNESDTVTLGRFLSSCPNCFRPEGLYLMNATQTSLSVAWLAGNNTGFQVTYALYGHEPDWSNAAEVYDSTYFIDNLQAATAYNVYVRTICDGEASAATVLACMTPCEPTGCAYSIVLRDNSNYGFLGNSIEVVNEMGFPVDTLYINRGGWSGNEMSKQLSYCPGKYYLRWLPTGIVYPSFYQYFYVQLINSEEQTLLDFNIGNKEVDNWLDSFYFQCPTCFAPETVGYAALDSTRVRLTWNSMGDEVTYLIEYGYQGHEEGARVSTTDTSIILTGLTPDMLYEGYIGTLCPGNDTSRFRQFGFMPGPRKLAKVYVSQEGQNNGGVTNGSSWNTAFRSIADAQYSALEQGRLYGNYPDIWVARGTYYENLTIYPSQHLYGGFAGNEPADYDLSQRNWGVNGNLTVVDGSWNGPCLVQDAPFTAATASSFDGFLFGGGETQNGTGGVSLKAYTTLRNCIVENSHNWNQQAPNQHGLFSVEGDPNNIITVAENCTFQSGVSYGSVIYVENARIDNALFVDNSSTSTIVELGAGASLRHCNVLSNQLYLEGNSPRYLINLAGTGATVVNSIVAHNNAQDTLADGMYVWSWMTTGQVNSFNGVTYSAFNGTVSGTGNISVDTVNAGTDPQKLYVNFMNPDEQDFRLNGGSACIDAGTALAGFGSADMGGEPRVYGSAPDMGCYENQGTTVCMPIRNLSVHNLSVDSARVTWETAMVDSYEVSYKAENAEQWTTVSSLSVNNYLMAGLTQYTNYMVRVRANCDGTLGEYSDTLVFNSGCNYPTEAVVFEDPSYYSTTNPVATGYPMSMGYFIVKASELGNVPRTIHTIGFQPYQMNSPVVRNWQIAFYTTTAEEITDETFDNLGEPQLVYSGEVTLQGNWDWVYIPLTQAYQYDGESNLVVGIFDSTGTAAADPAKFLIHWSSSNVMWTFYGSDYENLSGPFYSSLRPDFYINDECDLSTCPRPRMRVDSVGEQVIRLAFERLNGTPILEYSTDGSQWTAVSGLTAAMQTFSVTGLTGNTTYFLRLHCDCGNGDTSTTVQLSATTAPIRYEHVYVKADATGAGNGYTWEDAFTDLNAAVAMARASYDAYGEYPDIRVATGVYYGDVSGSEDAFFIEDPVSIYGGFAGNEPADYDLSQRNFEQNTTILDGQHQRRVLKLNPYNHNWVDYRPVYDGITIRNGRNNQGAGVYVDHQVVLNNLRIEDCHSWGEWNGEGVALYFNSNGSLVSNTAITRCAANYGTIQSSRNKFVNCDITYCGLSSEWNSNSYYYAGMNSSYDTVIGCRFMYDSCYSTVVRGYGSYFENCLIADNLMGGLYAVESNFSTFVGCDVVNNVSAEDYNPGMYLYYTNVANSIVWGNRSANSNNLQVENYSSTLYHSAIQGWNGEDNNNIGLAPENTGSANGVYYPYFASPETGDYRLMGLSACIDGGDSTWVRTSTDLAGLARIYGDAPDMGCYENHNETFCVPPYGISVQTSSNVALFSWDLPTDVSAVQLEYREVSAETWTVVENITATSHMIDNLEPLTSYEYRMKGICDNDAIGSYSPVKLFTTECVSGSSLAIVGDSNSTNTSSQQPLTLDNWYSTYYSFSQQIFLQSEMGAGGIIDTIRFRISSGDTVTRAVKVYLGNTSHSVFENNYDCVMLPEQQLVYEGPFFFPNDNMWVTLPLQSPFDYNGYENLVLTVIDTTGVYYGNRNYFVTDCNYSQGTPARYYSSYEPINISSDLYDYRSSCRNVVAFSKACGNIGCVRPLLAVSDVTDASATVTCQTGTGIELQYKSDDDNDYTPLAVTASQVLSALRQNTGYSVRARMICGSGDTSLWRTLHFTTLPGNQSRYYVAAGATGNGTSWNDASGNLAWTLNTAAVSASYYRQPVDVWVAEGTYYGNFTMVDGINVYGGFAGNESDDYNLNRRDFKAHASILDAQGNGRVLAGLSDMNTLTEWDGFTLRNGTANSGGGLYISGNITVNHFTVENCWAENGGGIYVNASNYRRAIIKNTSVKYCRSYYSGAGIYSSRSRLENCEVSYCSMSYYWANGGGIYSYGDTVIGCRFIADTAANGAAGAYISNSYFESCLFTANYSQNNSTVLVDYATLAGCDIVKNTVVNSTDNPAIAKSSSYSYNPTIVNSIIWGNRNLANNSTTQMTLDSVRYCAVEGGFAGTGNVALASTNDGTVQGALYPLFASPDDYDFRLLEGSPCIDAGSDADMRFSKDLKGDSRIIGDHVDMGCFENDGSVICVYPSNLAAAVSSSAAIVSWNKPRDAIATELQYRLAGSETWTSVENLTGSSHIITALQPSSTYEYRMKSFCDDEETSGYTTVKEFTTECSEGNGELLVGDTTNLYNSSYTLPLYTDYPYSLSQQLFLQSEVGDGGVIDTIRFRQDGGNDENRSVKIYIGHTSRNVYSSSNDFLLPSQHTLVFDGSINLAPQADGWLTIPLQTSFAYNGVDNLVLTVVDTTGSSQWNYNYFYTTYHGESRALYTANYSPIAISTDVSYNRYSECNVVLFSKGCPNAGCPRPLLAVDNVTDASATLTCELPAGAGVDLQYRKQGDVEYITLPVQQNQTLNNLRQNTSYEVRVRATCPGNETSLWRTAVFTTLPKQQSRFYVTTTGRGDGSSWANATSDLAWAINTAATGYQYFHQPVTIWVAEGTYPGEFSVREGVNVYGGFVGNEGASYILGRRNFDSHPTILDGESRHRVLFQEESFGEQSALWDGFTFTGGRTTSNGGAAYLRGGVTLRNIKVTNSCASSGGGLYSTGDGPLSVINALFSGDSASSYGGAIYVNNAILENILVNNNVGSVPGIYLGYNCKLTSATVVNNRSTSGGYSAIYLSSTYSDSVRNTIVWGNRDYRGSVLPLSSQQCFRNSALEGIGDSLLNGNILLGSSNEGPFAPQFVSPTPGVGLGYSGGDWHLQQGSLCVNRGDNSFVSQSGDLDRQLRLQNGTVDMGCYESPYDSVPLTQYGSIVYVKEQASGTADGSSWEDATDDLNFAQLIARSRGIHRVWVAQGVYYGNPDVTDGVFSVTPGVSVYGGFQGNEPESFDLSQRDLSAHASILDGGNQHRVLYQESDIYDDHLFLEWNGFTIRNGNARDNNSYSYDNNGGGAYLRRGTTLANCTLTGNKAYYGGGLYLSGSYSTVTLNGHPYRNYSSRVVNCTVTANEAVYGGGIYNQSLVSNCLVTGNRAEYKGGGIYNASASSVVNTTIAANTSLHDASGGYYGTDSYSDYSKTLLANSIVWGNKRGYEVSNLEGFSLYGRNAVEGGIPDSLLVLNLESANDGGDASKLYPRFMDPQHGDYTIHVTSPCVNYGDSTLAYYLPETDLAGNPRQVGESVDLGCYETTVNGGCPSVVNVTASNVTSTSATITWTPMGGETSWTVMVRQEGESETSVETVSEAELQLTGLTLNRTYIVYVRPVCDTGASIYSIPAVFNTLCDSTVLDTLDNFATMTVVEAYGERTLQEDHVFYTQTLNFSWTSMAMATSYDFYFWKEGDEEPSTPTRRGLTTAGVNGFNVPNFYDNHGMQFHWKVVAWNECINKTSPTMTVQEAYLPDLHVSNVELPESVKAGQPFTIQWTVTNDGQGSTPPGANWVDYIWITGHNGVGGGYLYYADETLLTEEQNLQALEPGGSYTASTQVTIPQEYYGGYFIFVMADQHCANGIDYSPTGDTVPPIPYNPSATGYLTAATTSWPGACINSQIEETHEGDNFFYVQKSILPPPTPDLQVTQIQHPFDVTSGDTVTFRYRVSNMGDAAATGRWYDAVYITNEDTLDYSRALLMGVCYHEEEAFNIGASYDDSVTAVLPLRIDGAYHVYVRTDVENTIYERIYEANNVVKSVRDMNVMMAPTPDLVVTAINMESDSVSAASTYTLTYTVKNQGMRGVTGEYWKDAVYISAVDTFDAASARRIGTHYNYYRTLEMDSSYSETVSVTMPDSIEAMRYIFVKTDVDNQVFEYTSDTNNVRRKETPVQILLPDLQAGWDSIPEEVEADHPVTLRWYVKNVGQGDVNNRSIRNGLTFYGQTIAQHSGNITLAAGDSVVYTETLTLPCRASEMVTIMAKADMDSRIYETNEMNNSSSVELPVVGPDLSVSNLMVPPTTWSGTKVMATWTLTNNGALDVDAEMTDRFYLGNATTYSAADSMGSFTRHVTLAVGESITESFQISLPDGVQGEYHVHQMVNAGGDVCEGLNEASNHTVSNATNVQLSPYPDLVITNLDVPSSLNIGETFTMGYTTANNQENATGPLINKSVVTRFYISRYATFSANSATLIGDAVERMSIPLGGEVTNNALLRIPTTVTNGLYYIYAVTDATDAVYEYHYENNNTTRTNDRVTVDIYPLDLAVSNIEAPASVDWGANETFTVTVHNNSSVPTLAHSWNTQLYLSQDEVLHSTDTKLGTTIRYTELGGDSSYTVSFSAKVPYGMTSPAYLIALVDPEHYNPDTNTANNIRVQPLVVNSVPTADLAVTAATILDEQVYSGQDARIAYTVTNVSEQAITDATWTDKVFLSSNSSYETTDEEVGNTTKRDMMLAAGESYTDTATFRVPLPQNGTLYLIVRANSGNNFYETNTDNNLRAVESNVVLPQPGDLIVSDILMEGAIISGETLHVNWKVKNVGDNTLAGNGLRTLAYLSTNTAFDASDQLLGSVNSDNVNLIPGGEMVQQLQARVSAMPEGEYYVIVKTDVSRVFNEVNISNNTGCSAYPFNLTLRNLPFNTPVPDTLFNNLAVDYKLNVDTNTDQTVRIFLESEDQTSGAVNTIYVSHNTVGSSLGYDFSTLEQTTYNPELYIPATEAGYYGVNIQGSSPTADSQAVVIEADILPFELRSVSPNRGGNTGRVTMMLTGSRFSSDMQVTLTGADGIVLRPVTLTYENYYKAFATFDLNGQDTGLYDVTVTHPTEGADTLVGGFRIEAGTPENLYTNVIFPQSPRPNRVIVAMLEYGNVGNTDIVDPKVTLSGISGTPISLTASGLADSATSLQIPLSVDGDLPGILRPGVSGYINVYINTLNNLTFYIDRPATNQTTVQLTNDTATSQYAEMTAVVLQPEGCEVDSNGSVTVVVPEGMNAADYTFRWMTMAGDTIGYTQTLTGLVSGGYLVEVTSATDANFGYSDYVYVDKIDTCNTLRVSIASSSYTDVCATPSVENYATAIGGVPPYTYSWPNRRYTVTGVGRYQISCRVVDAEGHVAYGNKELYLKNIECSVDPNEIKGPEGYDEELHYVAATEKMNYTIGFENDPDFATAPATRVTVVYPVPEGQDIRSMRLSDFGFGDHTFSVPANSTTYTKRLDVSADLGIWVDVRAGIDIKNNRISWVFQSIDPATGDEPLSAQMGFLPVNDTLGSGEGFVSFFINPKEGRRTGDTVAAEATIVFDDNAPIATNIWKNTFDAIAPTSRLQATVPVVDSNYCIFTFSAADDANGSGVDHVELYVSQNDGAYEYYASAPVDSTLRYTLLEGGIYHFVSVAVDHVGNRETLKALPDTVINNSTAPRDILLTSSNFHENAAVATVIGRLTTIDNDVTQPFVYELVEGEGSTDNALFAIANGRLVTNSLYNCNGRYQYSVRIRTTDITDQSFEKVFVLNEIQENFPAATSLSDAICQGDNYTFGTHTLTTANVYVDSLHTVMGCDSIVTLNLAVNPVYSISDNQTACDTYTWPLNNQTYTASTSTPAQTLQTIAGCDSTITLNLTVNYSTTGTDNQTACDSYTWLNGTTYTADNSLDTVHLTNAAGCDSTVTLNLTIRYSTAYTDVQTACDSYTWPLNGTTYTASSSTDTVHLTNAAGCDSTVTLNLTIRRSTVYTDNRTACDSYTWPLNGTVYTSSNSTDTIHLSNAAGCDSTVTLNLTINHSTTGIDNQTACDSYTWLSGTTYTASNSTDTIHTTNVLGCDSTVTLNLTINNSTTSTDVQTACDSYTWLNGITYTADNSLDTVHLTNAAGCDSTVTLNLTILHSTAYTDEQTACDSYTWPLNGTVYTASNSTDTVMRTNGVGCDSTVTLNLTIRHSTASTDVQTACDTYTWPLNGTVYTAGNTTDTVMRTNAAGCDSTITLHLTLNVSTTGEETVEACNSYVWNGNEYNTSGNYTSEGLLNAAGCDSTATLHLTVNHCATTTLTVCDSYLWPINGTTYTVSGTYTTADGDTLILTVNHSSTGIDVQTACDQFIWHGETYTTSTLDTLTLIGGNTSGCDSTITLNLTINYSTTGEETVEACNSYAWNGTVYTLSGDYTSEDLLNAAGCDSTATLHLTVVHCATTTLTVCDSYLWPLSGTTYTVSGTYTTTDGDTLILTVNNSSSYTDVQTACDQFTWHGETYTVSTDSATVVLTNAAGCDSTVTLNLTINNSTIGDTVATACDNFTWYGTVYSASTETPTHTLANVAGCDSTVTLHLTVNYSAEVMVNDTAERSYTWHGNTYTESGTYTWNATTEAGCDSTVTLVLVIENVGIDEVGNAPVRVYPNPTRGIVTIEADNVTSIEVFDMVGHLVATYKDTDKIDFSVFSAGSYTLRIRHAGGVTLKRVIRAN